MNVCLLSNLNKHVYGDEVNTVKEFSLCGAKGERIAFQLLILKPCHNVKITFKTNWKKEVFFEKYINIKNPTCNFTKSGEYPDILIDEERAEKFKENYSEKGELPVWCFLDAPCKCESKEYAIEILVKADEFIETLYVKIFVMDFMLPKQNHNRVSLLVRDDMISGTQKEIDEKYDELIDLGLKYRMSPTRIIPWGDYENDIILEKMKRLTLDKRCNSYSIPCKKNKKLLDNGKTEESIDIENLHKLFLEMAEESSDECDLFEKANIYVIDEPEPEHFNNVRKQYQDIYNLKRQLVKEYDFTNKRKVELSLLTMDNIVTVFNKEPIYGEVDTWCPTYWGYHKPEYVYEEEKLRCLGKKNWWYGCVAPTSPFPNLHTDSPMKEHRFESWLRYKNNIKGNLYWASNITKKWTGKEYIEANILEETMLYPGANGDGLLFYTETKYGKPLPSIRVMSMFLGLQEYEYFIILEKYVKYAESYYGAKLDINNILAFVFNEISFGMMFLCDFDVEKLRRQIGIYIELAKNNIFILSEINSKSVEINAYCPNGTMLRINGIVGEEKISGKGKIVSVKINGTREINVKVDYNILTQKKSNILPISHKRIPINIKNIISENKKISLTKYKDSVYCLCESFVNEENISVFIPFKDNLGNMKDLNFYIESFCNNSFIVNSILVDMHGKEYVTGYEVVIENKKNKIRIPFSKLTQNRLNCIEDVLPAKNLQTNQEISNNFDFKNVSGIRVIIQNNIKLLDENRERIKACYSFIISDAYITLNMDNRENSKK